VKCDHQIRIIKEVTAIRNEHKIIVLKAVDSEGRAEYRAVPGRLVASAGLRRPFGFSAANSVILLQVLQPAYGLNAGTPQSLNRQARAIPRTCIFDAQVQSFHAQSEG